MGCDEHSLGRAYAKLDAFVCNERRLRTELKRRIGGGIRTHLCGGDSMGNEPLHHALGSACGELAVGLWRALG